MIRNIERREHERERRLLVGRKKSSKAMRDSDRDVSEVIALGQAQPSRIRENLYDQRLFNQTSGLDSSFGDEGEHYLFSQPLFRGRDTALFRNIEGMNDEGVEGDKTKNQSNKIIEFEKKRIEY